MNIMIGLDGSETAERAMERGLLLFKSVAPTVMLVSVIEEPLDASDMDEQVFDKWRGERQAYLKETAEKVAAQGFEVDVLVAVGDPRRMLRQAIERATPDVLIVGRRGAGGIEELHLGSVSAYLARHAASDILIIRG